MSLIKDSLQKQIDNNNRLQFNDTTGTILEYDRTTQICKIKYLNPNGDGYIYRGNVPIINSSGGLFHGGIHAGQKCSISFINGNIYNPIIVGLHENFYNNRSCTDQGAYIADDDIWKVSTPEHIVAMNLDWINDSNTSLSKYQNSSCKYTDCNVDEQAMELITTLDKYEDDEVGITNLKNNSTVKLRDNGDIDIFCGGNVGLRICKNTGNIKLYANDVEFTKTDGESEKTDKSISTQLKIAQIMKICLAYDIIKEVDTYVDAINEAVENSTDVNGDFS